MDRSRLARALRRLRETDWDLEGAWTAQDLHDLHWYPASFPPQLPRLLVSLFSDPSERVLDPFCGSGTTLVECVKARRTAWGIEQNPVGELISRAKLFRYSPSDVHRQFRAARLRILSDFDEGLFALRETTAERQVGSPHWYHNDTLAELRRIWTLSRRMKGHVGRLIVCAFSGCLKATTAQRRHWGYVADNMRPKELIYRPARDIFFKRLEQIEYQLQSLATQLSPWKLYEPFARGTRVYGKSVISTTLPSESVDLVITSPPYLGVTDYVRSQRLTFDWFGWELDPPAATEIGARWKRFRKDASDVYLCEMANVASKLSRWLKPQAICILVVGQSRVRDRDNQIMGSIVDNMAHNGMVLITDPICRQRSKQRVVSRSGETSSEAIYVFQKSR